MDIQQWIGILGIIAYWLFRAYTASKKGSKNAAPPVKKASIPRAEPIPERQKNYIPVEPAKPVEGQTYPWESANKDRKNEEEISQKKVFSYEDADLEEEPKTKAMPLFKDNEDLVAKIKLKDFSGREAVIYQAILNRPQH